MYRFSLHLVTRNLKEGERSASPLCCPKSGIVHLVHSMLNTHRAEGLSLLHICADKSAGW